MIFCMIKIKYKLLAGMFSFLLIATAIVNAEEGVSAGDLRGQAEALYKAGQTDEAVVALQKARAEYKEILNSSPDDVLALRGLSETLSELGEYIAANSIFQGSNVQVNVKDVVVAPVSEEVAVIASEAAVTIAMMSNALVTTEEIDVESVEVVNEPSISIIPSVIRGIELQLDLLYNGSMAVVENNIALFVKRATTMGVNAVFVHAFTEYNADGACSSAYFKNSLMPVRANIMEPLVEALAAHDVAVYAVMPLLSFDLPNNSKNNKMLVMSKRMGVVKPSVSWRRRLSPFSTNAISFVTEIYSNLASNVPLNGIVFGDDAYLTDLEDLNPDSFAVYSNKLGITKVSLPAMDPKQCRDLANIRRDQLDLLCGTVMAAVREDHPNMQFVRTLYASAINNPSSEEWLAQNYNESLQLYDRVLVLANPELEDARSRGTWMRKLTESVVAEPSGAAKTVFLLPSYSEVQRNWISDHQQAKVLRILVKAGISNFVIGPDDYRANHPRLKKAKRLF